jgi:hypothetical protein
MTKPLLLSCGTLIPSSILHHPEMKAAVKVTLIQFIRLTWGNNRRATPPLSYRIMEQLTRQSQRRLYRHHTVHRTNFSALELQDAGNGTFVIKLADWLFVPPRDDVFKQTPVKEEESILNESRGDSSSSS